MSDDGQLGFGFGDDSDGTTPTKGRQRRRCPHCGASLLEHAHNISRPLVAALAALERAGGGPLNIRELKLTRNQWDNFQKLRYFGLVAREGKRSGVWSLTMLGRSWLDGAATVPRRAWTFRGEVQRFDGPPVRVQDVDEGYRKGEDYAADARPREAT